MLESRGLRISQIFPSQGFEDTSFYAILRLLEVHGVKKNLTLNVCEAIVYWVDW